MKLIRWWLIVCSIVAGVESFKCPKGEGCGDCRLGFEQEIYSMNCATTPTGTILVQILPEYYVRLMCRNLANWTNFNLASQHPVRGVNALSFENCNLPEPKRLGSIAKNLIVDEIESLLFRSAVGHRSNLTSDTFHGLDTLKDLILSVDLSAIPENIFGPLANLQSLNLQNSNLHFLPDNIFASTSQLEAIELSSNQLTSLNPAAFRKLHHLRLLNAWNNKINNLSPNTFDELVALEALGLQRNKLETLPNRIFARLRNLKSINLSQNDFTSDSLPSDLLANCTKLRIVLLMENRRNITSLPNGFFSNLTNLNVLKLKKIGLVKLSEDLFHGAINLETIILERNFLSTIPVNIFRDNRQLSSLDFSFNEIASLPDRVFSNLQNLVKLNLAGNHITSVSVNLFIGLTSLLELNMERNNIIAINDRAFASLGNLRIAKFSFNWLTLRSSGNTVHSPFHYAEKLEELRLDHNNISNIFADWMFSMNSMRVLDLAYNKLQYLMHQDMQFLSENLLVDLSHNNISHVYLAGVELWATERSYSRNLVISIEENPIECDCNIYDLLRYLEGRLHDNVRKAFSLRIGRTECHEPTKVKKTLIKELRSKTLVCKTRKMSKLTNSCPDRCGCYVRPENRACLIDCANEGLVVGPEKFECPSDHTIELDLSGNSLTSMPAPDWPGFERISVLDLNHNDISSISIETLPPNIEILRLNDNALSRLDQEVIEYFENSTKLKELTLHSNPWMCDCENRALLNLIQKKSVEMPELRKVNCEGRESLPIYQMTPADFCSRSVAWIAAGCLLVAFIGIILGTTAALYYRYQKEIKVWLYAKNLCLWLVTENELDRDKIFDAFISYSHKDEDFVVNELMPNLEAGPRPFKLCVHFRNWLAGEWIPKQIANSVEESRRTIVVLSPNFLESVWGRMEFRAAHSQALSEGRARLIVILYGDIGPTEDLDPELKAYLSTNTYVKWGEPWFWQKLKYAMPHPPEFTTAKQLRRQQNLFIQTTQPPCIRGPNEKSEFIDVPSLVPSNSMHIIMQDDPKFDSPTQKTNSLS